jgi:hypothetical protein
MACDDCPEYIVAAETTGVAILVYSGGPPTAIFESVKFALARDDPKVIRKWSKPTVHKDGSIEYTQNEAEPPEIEGYSRDPNNPRRLKPCWPPCAWRILRVWRADNGSVKITCGCVNPTSGHKPHEDVTLENCKTCARRTI